MESIAVVRFVATDHEGKSLEALGYGVAVLLVKRFNRSRRLAAKLVELREQATDSDPEPAPTRPIRARERSDRDVPLSSTRATHWIRGEVHVEGPNLTLALEMTSIGVGAGEPRRIWATEYECDSDTLCDVLNQLAQDVVKRITKVEPEYVSRLTIETRSFEAFSAYCSALFDDCPRPYLERACAEDPWFIAAFADLALTHLEADDTSAYQLVEQQIVQAGHLRRQSLAQELVLMGMRGWAREGLNLAIVSLTLAPNDPYLQEAAAELALEIGGDNRLIEILVGADTRAPAASAVLATLFAKAENEERASYYLHQTIKGFETCGGTAEAYYRLGINAMRLSDHQGAEGFLLRSLELDKAHEAARANLAAVYLHGMHFERAATLLAQSNADDAISQSNLALALRHTGRMEEAGYAAQRAIEADPMHPQAWGIIGDLARTSGNMERASSAFRTAAELEPSNPVWSRELGRVLFHAGKTQDAVVVFRELLTHHEEMAHQTPEVLCVLAQFAEQVQGIDEAEQLYRRALRLNAGLWQASNNLGILLVSQAKFEEARYWFERGLETNPNNEEINANLRKLADDEVTHGS